MLEGLIIGLGILASITGGLAIFTGLSKLSSKNKENESVNACSRDTTEEPKTIDESSGLVEIPQMKVDNIPATSVNRGKKSNFAQKLGRAAEVCVGLCEVVGSVGTLVGSIGKIFGGGSLTGNYAGYPQLAGDGGYDKDGDPYDVPIFKGKDPHGNPIYWIKRRNGITEVL